MTNLQQIREFIIREKKGKEIVLWKGEEVVAKVNIAIDYSYLNTPRYEYSLATEQPSINYFWVYQKLNAAEWVIQKLQIVLRSVDLEEFTLTFEKFINRNNIYWNTPEDLILMLMMNEAGMKTDKELADTATLTFRGVRTKAACNAKIRLKREEIRRIGSNLDSFIKILVEVVGAVPLYKKQFLDLYPSGEEYFKSGNKF